MTIPTYQDGKPINLQAAIIDAMYWLRVLRSRLYDEPQLPLTERKEQQVYLRRAIEALEGFLPEDDAHPVGYSEASPVNAPPPGSMVPATPGSLRGEYTIKARYCKICSCELDEFTLAKQGDHTCRKCKEDAIKEKLRAKQQRMGISEG